MRTIPARPACPLTARHGAVPEVPGHRAPPHDAGTDVCRARRARRPRHPDPSAPKTSHNPAVFPVACLFTRSCVAHQDLGPPCREHRHRRLRRLAGPVRHAGPLADGSDRRLDGRRAAGDPRRRAPPGSAGPPQGLGPGPGGCALRRGRLPHHPQLRHSPGQDLGRRPGPVQPEQLPRRLPHRLLRPGVHGLEHRDQRLDRQPRHLRRPDHQGRAAQGRHAALPQLRQPSERIARRPVRELDRLLDDLLHRHRGDPAARRAPRDPLLVL